MSTDRPSELAKRTVNEWLRVETQSNLSLLTKLREKLELSLDPQPDIDPRTNEQRFNSEDQPMWLPPDLNESGTPSRDWCRAYARYHNGWSTILIEERERYKMRLLAHRAGFEELSDDEFTRGLEELAAEAVANKSVAELETALARARQAERALAEGDPDARKR